MIKIDLDATAKGKNCYVVSGSVEVRGDIKEVATEMIAVIRDFEEHAPEAWFIAIKNEAEEV